MPAYLLRPGTTPGVALYTRCEDELLCRAELLALLQKTNRNSPQDQQVSGYYDVDPTYTIARFKRGYRGRGGRRIPEADGHAEQDHRRGVAFPRAAPDGEP